MMCRRSEHGMSQRRRGPLHRSRVVPAVGTCLAHALLLAPSVHALDPNTRLTQYSHTSFRMQDGSAPSGMYSITQTADGFLWFLSSRGEIYRFDGVEFRSWHKPADVESIGRIRNIVGDRTGGFWALGAKGIAHLKNDLVTGHVELDGLMANPQNVSIDADDSIWVVRGANGTSEPLCHVTENTVQCFGKADGIPIAPVDALLADGNGGFWLGGQTALVHWHAGVSETYPIQGAVANGAPGILGLARGPDGSIWIGVFSDGAGHGLARLEEGAVRSFVTPTFDGSKLHVFALRFDHDGDLWVGTDSNGVLRVRGNSAERYARTEGLSGGFVRAFLENRDGSLWVATSNGIDKFHDPGVISFTAAEGLSSDSAVGLLAGRDGSIWVANSDALDHIVAGSVTSTRWPGQQVSSLLEDRRGNLWVGANDGLYLFKDGRFRRLPEPNGQPLGLIFGLIEDADGTVWAHCFCGGTGKLLRIRDFKVQDEFSAPQVPGGRLAPDPQEGIWIGTRTGDLVLFRDGVPKRFPTGSHDNPFPNQIVAQADGAVLAAFDDGLVGLRQGVTQRMTTKNGLPCGSIFAFVQSGDKRWWLNTQCGVVEFPDSELQRWWADPDAVIRTRVYDVLDGARPSARPPFNPAGGSPDGRVWFVNSGVVQMLDPARLSRPASPAQTYIESIVVDRKGFPATHDLKLAPHPRDLEIDYTSPSFLIPQKVRFRYRLDPADHDWHDAGTRRRAFYTDLAPGKYTFRVMASNGDGVWNNAATTLALAVAPAFYQTLWFRALGVALFAALLWAAYQTRVRHLRRDSQRLRNVIETIPAIVFEVEPDGSAASANRRWVEYTGSTLRQLGRLAPEDPAWRDATRFHSDDLDGYVALWKQAMATGQSFQLEIRVRRADGVYRWFLLCQVPFRDEQGTIRKWFGTLSDIEDRKRTEQQQERLRRLEADLAHINRVSTLGELTASIAHEVNQPLSGVVSNGGACVRWLDGEVPDLEEARAAARRIVRDGKRAGEIIARIRALTRRKEVPREPLDLNASIREVLALVSDRLKQHDVILRTDLADDVFPVLGDQVQLQQVVLNLIMNAIDAMSNVRERARELVLTTRNTDADQVQVSVEDCGIGLDPSSATVIFDSFYTTKAAGMGMGLSICRSILQAHGGRLWVTPKDGPGTVFCFALPRYAHESATATLTGD
jgi:PAS domain S-box-containing protein